MEIVYGVHMAYYTVVARRTLTPAEEAQPLSQLTSRLQDTALPDKVIRTPLAPHILETGGEGHARALINVTSQRQPPGEVVAKAPLPAAHDRETATRNKAGPTFVAEKLNVQPKGPSTP